MSIGTHAMADDSWKPPRSALRRACSDMARQLDRPDTGGEPDEVRVARTDPRRGFGRYVLVQFLGRGGAGEIWKAWDGELERWVAVKVMHESFLRQHRARLFREARSAARVRHPHLVTVHEVGEHEGRPFIVMALVQGKEFEPKSSLDESLTVLESVAEALETAHRAGVIHRDVKPSNILIDRNGDPCLVDFGLAHIEDAGDRLTCSGAVLGTPAYMAPEQVEGRSREVGPHTDVYALGVILCEALEGRTPHTAASLPELYSKILHGEILPPRGPRDLVRVCMKALQRKPDHRYRSAGELAGDLRRCRLGEPVLAEAPFTAPRWIRSLTARRVPWAVLVLLLLAVVPVFFLLRPGPDRRSEEVAELSAMLQLAEMAARLGEVPRAGKILYEGIEICERRLREEEGAELRYFLGRFHEGRRDPEAAIREWTRALELNPQFAAARLSRGIARFGLMQVRQMEMSMVVGADMDRAKEVGNLLERWMRGALEDLAGGFGEAPHVTATDRSFAGAVVDWLRGNRTRARATLEEILAEDPLHTRAQLMLARFALVDGDLPRAERLAEEAAARNRGSIEAYLACAMARIRRGEPDDMGMGAKEAPVRRALADLDRAHDLGCRSASLFGERGYARMILEEDGPALEDFNRALEARPDFISVLVNRGMLRARMGDENGGMQDVARAAQTWPNDAVLRFNLGYLWTQKAIRTTGSADADALEADWREAVREFTRTIELDSTYSRAYFERANARAQIAACCAARNDLPQAFEFLEGSIADSDQALRMEFRVPSSLSKRAMTRVIRAELLAREGDDRASRAEYRIAREDLELALKVAPQDWSFREAVANLLERIRDR